MSPVYNTPQGHELIRQILAQGNPPVYPHDYQTEGVSISLDGESLMATMATGSGKTAYFSHLMLVILAISRDPSLAL